MDDRLSWEEFDQLARGLGGPDVVRRLRRAERGRRMLLLRAILDKAASRPGLVGPLPTVDTVWDLLDAVQLKAPRVLDLLLAHPYTGTWAGYTTRQLGGRIDSDGPLWTYVGHVHALAAAAAVRAGIPFQTRIPLRHGKGVLPTLGMVHLAGESEYSTADVHSDGDDVEISTPTTRVRLPRDYSADGPNWWGMRQLVAESDGLRLAVRLDDLDPYRSLYRPAPPQRLESSEVRSWQSLVDGAWRLIVRHLPELAKAVPAGLDSLVARPAVPFGELSASTAEAFGSAIVSKPPDAESLAATLVHEFAHIRLSGLLQLKVLHDDDPRQRFYTPWRDDPRPVGGVLHGVFAFFGVTEFWRALAGPANRLAAFEFARWRSGTWSVLRVLRDDPSLTEAGRRFVSGIAERLGPWQDELVPADIAGLAEAVADDHRAGWRIRFVRPDPGTIDELASGWLSKRTWPAGLMLADDGVPAPEPDGPWSSARTKLARLAVAEPGRTRVTELGPAVPDAAAADLAYAAGRYDDAVLGYRAELAADPDHPPAWAGLGLALSVLDGSTSAAARALLWRPEVVRAVHRRIRELGTDSPRPDELAYWIGCNAFE